MPQEEYENLKCEIIREADNSLNLEQLKETFNIIINSRRKLSRIKNLNDIFNILEKCDALDPNNVYVLKYLGNVLENEKIKTLVHGYEKLYVEEECCLCGKSLILSLPIINPVRQNSEQEESHELQKAMKNIALNIGEKWRVLASELRIPECHIDEVREKYPNDFRTQAIKILEVWKKYYGKEATLDVLKCKLESRLCKIKGLGIHMLKPIITVE